MAISESQIVFYSGGGHNHDGVSSSLISTSDYSVFDFSFGVFGDPDRMRSQVFNANALEQYIISTVNSSVLQPAGIFLQNGTINGVAIIDNTVTANQIAANTITAAQIFAGTITADLIAANTITAAQIATNAITSDEIAAGAITASELAANIVLVNNIISSNNYVTGVSGWAVNSNGTAEFANTSIRGTIIASQVSTPGIDINADGSISSTNFNVTAGGNLTASNVDLTGEITASSGVIAGFNIVGDKLSRQTGAYVYPYLELDAGGALKLQSGGAGSYRITMSPSAIQSEVNNALFANFDISNCNIVYSTIGSTNTFQAVNCSSVSSSGNIQGTGVFATQFVWSGNAGGSANTLGRRGDGFLLLNTSKRELKYDIEDITDSLNIINNLRPRFFKWKPRVGFEEDFFDKEVTNKHKNMGFILDEVYDVSKEYCEYIINDEIIEPSFWKPYDFIALAVQGIKDLNAKVSLLEQRIAGLEG